MRRNQQFGMLLLAATVSVLVIVGAGGAFAQDVTNDGNITITEIQADAPGDDQANLNGEFVRFEVQGEETINLGEYVLRYGDSGKEYIFPLNFEADPGDQIIVFSGNGTPQITQSDPAEFSLYANFSQEVLSDGDMLSLTSQTGETVLQRTYGDETPGEPTPTPAVPQECSEEVQLSELSPAAQDEFRAALTDDGLSRNDSDAFQIRDELPDIDDQIGFETCVVFEGNYYYPIFGPVGGPPDEEWVLTYEPARSGSVTTDETTPTESGTTAEDTDVTAETTTAEVTTTTVEDPITTDSGGGKAKKSSEDDHNASDGGNGKSKIGGDSDETEAGGNGKAKTS